MIRSLNTLLLFAFILPLYAQNDLLDLPRSTPREEGVPIEGIIKFLEAVEQSEHEMHSLMILKNGKVIAEGWWDPYGPKIKHTMYSVSKSFTATAIGFAVSEERLSVNDRVIDFFPDHLPEIVSPNLVRLRIRDLLSMSVGHEKEPTSLVVQSDNWIKTFLSVPILHRPGTQFQYNTVATYILSAIVQQVTQETVMDYLKPRLFQPLGISGIDWEVDPKGINTGGYGLRLKTEDMAKFGQLFLQKGQWNGKQILAEAWVKEASTLKIIQDPQAPKEKVENSDWLQGYGYQMWRSRHDSYRADGAFGQYILVMPKQDAVIAITSETTNMQGLLNMVWDNLLPVLDGKVKGKTDDKNLEALLNQQTVQPAKGISNDDWEKLISGNTYELEGNDRQIGLRFFSETCEMILKEGENLDTLYFGRESWVTETSSRKGPYLVAHAKGAMEGLAPFPVNGSYTWKDSKTLILQLNYTEGPHTETITMNFENEKVTLTFRSILNGNKIPETFIGNLVLEPVPSF